METISRFFYFKGLIVLLGLILYMGCAPNTSHLIPDQKTPTDQKITIEPPSSAQTALLEKEMAVPVAEEEGPKVLVGDKDDFNHEKDPVQANDSENRIQTSEPEAKPKSDQEKLDSALEFCQASGEYWEQGDLDNALDALDEAFSLILEVSPDQSPEILQQRDDLRFTISKRILEIYTSRATVTNGNHKAIPFEMNSHVQAALKLFKGKEKKFFLDSYRRSGRYRPFIIKALREAGLPEDISWLPLIESGFKVKAFSRARALGMWQFIASTGYKFGLKRNRWIDERMDPEKSTMAAIAYLKELHQIFGDWTTALAAYNCGEGAVLKAIRRQKINYLDNFWDLYEILPRETASYVPRFLAVVHILSDPEAHGIELPPVYDEFQTEKVAIEKQVHLKTVARHLDIPFKDLKELNPELRYDFTPDTAYTIRVPKDKKALFLAELDNIPIYRPPVPAYIVHRVRRGESLSTIANKYRTSVRSIMNLNRLRSKRYIKAGWKLKIPTRGRYLTLKRNIPAAPATRIKGKTIEYTVHKGDSLWKIANRFGTTTKAIQVQNQLKDTELKKGQVLIISRGLPTDEDLKTKSYVVMKGDSSYVIAQKHQMTLSKFLRINDLTPRSTIYPGQIVLVKAE